MLVLFLDGSSREIAITDGANLRGANLRGANLSGANLSIALLRSADLSSADLSSADLSDANLRGAILRGAILRGADLTSADLTGADLTGADLTSADLTGADLTGADLRSANLIYASLTGASLTGAELDRVRANGYTAGFFLVPPESGAFVAWKRVGGAIIKLQVPEHAQRSSATTRKCRVSKALVLDIDGGPSRIRHSAYGHVTVYEVGKTVYPDSWNPDRWAECSHGIHCFVTRDEAVKYR